MLLQRKAFYTYVLELKEKYCCTYKNTIWYLCNVLRCGSQMAIFFAIT